NQAVRDMVSAQRLFHDPTGIRRILTFGKIEPFVYKRRLPPLDVLNEAGRPWLDPTDHSVRHADTFDDMWDRAMDESIAVMQAVLEWLRHEAADGSKTDPVRNAGLRAQIAGLIGNRSYETGLPCGSADIRFADPIWPDGRGAVPEPNAG